MELEEDERKRGLLAHGSADGPTAFVMLGIEIEDLQCVALSQLHEPPFTFSRQSLKADVRTRPASQLNTLDHNTRTTRRLAIQKKIDSFRNVQAVHMPGLASILPQLEAKHALPEVLFAEDIPLYLPSVVAAAGLLSPIICDPRLVKTEDVLREAQCYEFLDDLRRQLRARTFANRIKIKNITGQRANTRARGWQKTIDNKAIAAKHAYRQARASLLALRGPGEWETVLRVLDEADVRAFNERALSAQERFEREEARRASGLLEEQIDAVPIEDGAASLGEGRRTISWIWWALGTTGLGSTSSEEDIHTGTFYG